MPAEFEYPAFRHPEMCRHPDDAMEDACAYRKAAICQLRTADPAVAVLVLVGVGYTDQSDLSVGYATTGAYSGPDGHDHMNALIELFPLFTAHLTAQQRRRLATKILAGNPACQGGQDASKDQPDPPADRA